MHTAMGTPLSRHDMRERHKNHMKPIHTCLHILFIIIIIIMYSVFTRDKTKTKIFGRIVSVNNRMENGTNFLCAAIQRKKIIREAHDTTYLLLVSGCYTYDRKDKHNIL